MKHPFRTQGPADRRLVIALRLPAQELACSLPGVLEPIAIAGMGLVLLDYAYRGAGAPSARHPFALPSHAVHHLAVRIPVRGGSGDRPALWVPRRYCSSRLATCALARTGGATRAERAAFELRVEGFDVELEVRGERGRVLYLRAETAGQLEGTLFRRPGEVEASLREWSRTYRSASLCARLDRPGLPDEGVALHPMLAHALQTSTLPELFPGVEEAVELECVLRQVHQRPVVDRAMQRTYLGQLTRGQGDLDAPPAGAFSVRG